MLSTRTAGLRPALNTTICTLATLVLLLLVTPASDAATRSHRSPCANKLCTKDLPRTPSCWRFHRDERVARCFIARAAVHYGQPKSTAFSIARRESRFHWRATNPSSGTAGLFQFARQTWQSTPYRHHSPHQPRWASLAAMWMWAHGGYSHWRL